MHIIQPQLCAVIFCRLAAAYGLCHSLSPNMAQILPLRLTICKYPRSRPLVHLPVKILCDLTMRTRSRSFTVPYYILVFALNTPRRLYNSKNDAPTTCCCGTNAIIHCASNTRNIMVYPRPGRREYHRTRSLYVITFSNTSIVLCFSYDHEVESLLFPHFMFFHMQHNSLKPLLNAHALGPQAPGLRIQVASCICP